MISDAVKSLMNLGRNDVLAPGGYSPLISGAQGQNQSVQSFSDSMGINPNANKLGGLDFMPNAVTDGGGMFGGLFSDSGLLSKDNLSMGSDLLGIGTGIMGMYNSMQDRSMMEDMIKYGKETANRNLANQATLTNDYQKDRAEARNSFTGGNRVYDEIDGSPIK